MFIYPVASVLGDFIIGSAIVLFYFGVILAWGFSIFDLFARIDLKGWQKAVWLIAVFALPLLGVLGYWVLRPHTARWRGSEIFDDETRDPFRDSRATELEHLVQLREEGQITEEEFDSVRRRLLAA